MPNHRQTSFMSTRALWLCCLLLGLATLAQAQKAPEFPRSDDFLLLEYDRHSMKLHRLDKTPLLRIYGSGRAEVYFSEMSPKAGLYQIQLDPQTLEGLVAQLTGSSLDQNASLSLAESVEQASAEQREKTSTDYYSSDTTVTTLNMFWVGAADDPLVADNLQSNSKRFPQLPQVATLADVERTLLALTSDNLGAPIGAPKRLADLKKEQGSGSKRP